MARHLRVECPCCATLLIVDPETGAILREERPAKRQHQSLDEALDQVRTRRKDAAARLERAMQENRNREEILEKKFQEARRKAAETDEPPPRPFEGD